MQHNPHHTFNEHFQCTTHAHDDQLVMLFCVVVHLAVSPYLIAGRQASLRRVAQQAVQQFSRLKKASVRTQTYFETHAKLLTLVLPKGPLDLCTAAKDDWALVPDGVETLLGSGPLGRTLFTFAGLGANAATYQKLIDSLLGKVVAEKFSLKSIDEFKLAAAARAEDFKAPGYFMVYALCGMFVGCAGCDYL